MGHEQKSAKTFDSYLELIHFLVMLLPFEKRALLPHTSEASKEQSRILFNKRFTVASGQCCSEYFDYYYDCETYVDVVIGHDHNRKRDR